MRYAFLNNFSQLLAADLAAGATTLTLDANGADLSNASADLVYVLTLDDGNGAIEIIHVTGASSNTLTIERGKEGTTDQAWVTGSSIEQRLTAGVAAEWMDLVIYGSNGSAAIGAGASAIGVNCIAAGANAEATLDNALVIGGGALAGGYQSVAIGTGFDTSLDPAQNLGNYNAGAHASGKNAVALGTGAKALELEACALGGLAWASGQQAIALGKNSDSSGDTSMALGAFTVASANNASAIGVSSEVTGEWGVSVGGYAKAGENGAAFGCTAEAATPYSVAIGTDSTVQNVVGGMHVTALSHLPATFYDPWVSGVKSAVTQGAFQVVLSTKTLDLTTVNDTQTLELPTGTMLFVDSIEVVVVGSDTPGGTPEIQVGTDAGTPADLLAATTIGKTAVGGREKHAPLTADGVTSIRAEVTTAGTGTTYQARVIVKGYVMEL